MKVAKEFSWEMGHRLPFHQGKCKNLHGHSYRAIIEFEGTVDENGMVVDFYAMKQMVQPVIEQLDHAFVLHKGDTDISEFLKNQGSKVCLLDFHSTAENLCTFLLSGISPSCPENIQSITVRLYETADAYAEETHYLNKQ
jgi:6-pyruvoyltetrahydropterin/6-carboxytetrahydropterin synthase